MTLDQQPASTHWVLDKRIPLAVVITIIMQTAGMVWWAANLSGRVASLEESRSAISSTGQEGRIIRLETVVVGVQGVLSNIDRKLDRLIETRPSP